MKQIEQSTLDFLTELKQNNDRDWFIRNRNRYLEAKANYEDFIQAVIDRISEFDPILKGLEAKTCTYRINLDIRFSNDKTLYKTHLGAVIVRGGKNNGNRLAGYYVHAEPGDNSMIAGGAYMPPMPWLTAIREKIDEQGDEFLQIINNKEFKKYFGELDLSDKLKSAPKGYARDHPNIEFLKLKSILVFRMITDKEITSKGSLELIVRASEALKPLNDFLNEY